VAAVVAETVSATGGAVTESAPASSEAVAETAEAVVATVATSADTVGTAADTISVTTDAAAETVVAASGPAVEMLSADGAVGPAPGLTAPTSDATIAPPDQFNDALAARATSVGDVMADPGQAAVDAIGRSGDVGTALTETTLSDAPPLGELADTWIAGLPDEPSEFVGVTQAVAEAFADPAVVRYATMVALVGLLPFGPRLTAGPLTTDLRFMFSHVRLLPCAATSAAQRTASAAVAVAGNLSAAAGNVYPGGSSGVLGSSQRLVPSARVSPVLRVPPLSPGPSLARAFEVFGRAVIGFLAVIAAVLSTLAWFRRERDERRLYM
jgi:hypothetical protein